MNWINASIEFPQDWNTAIVRMLPNGKDIHNIRLLNNYELILPIRKNAKNISISYYGSGKPFQVPVNFIEWLNTSNVEGLDYDKLSKTDMDHLLTIFHRIKHLNSHITDDAKIKEILLFFGAQGYKIVKK